MKSQLIALLGERPVETVNALSQLFALLVGSVLFYQSPIYERFRATLLRLGRLKQYIQFELGPTQFGFGIGTRPAVDDAPPRIYFLAALIIVALLIVSRHTPAYWALYPFKQGVAAVTVWGGLSVSWASLLIPLKSALLVIWFVLSLMLVWTAGFGIPFKALLFVLESLGQALSPGRFNFGLFATFVASGLMIIATGNDFWAPSP